MTTVKVDTTFTSWTCPDHPETIRREYTPATNPNWHPRCTTCHRPMGRVDSLGRTITPRAPKPASPPQIEGQQQLWPT